MSGQKMKELTDRIGNQLDMCTEMLSRQDFSTPWTPNKNQMQAAEDLGMSILDFVRTVIETRLTQDDSPEPIYDNDRIKLGCALQTLIIRRVPQQ